MKNALKYGLMVGAITGVYIFIMHLLGVYHQTTGGPFNIHWLEYIYVLVPFTVLFLGIRNFRNNYNGGRLEFFEGIMEGFKIIIVGFVLYAAVGAIYMQYSGSTMLTLDYFQRIGAAGIIAVVVNVIVSLALMNKQHNL
ncbi:DUF4199 domain-containing protein [Pedobacter sp. SYSU D00535]|uniref:DUF4199 domain-containing protein n=1 Tax=Pedobacter sp. SYSU D00535 TaxID=2810308 RepID=UPI001A97BAC8|nr:DUF4199 domain-containing protein [Pedobacter sp. SYSU D00535]